MDITETFRLSPVCRGHIWRNPITGLWSGCLHWSDTESNTNQLTGYSSLIGLRQALREEFVSLPARDTALIRGL